MADLASAQRRLSNLIREVCVGNRPATEIAYRDQITVPISRKPIATKDGSFTFGQAQQGRVGVSDLLALVALGAMHGNL
jgi:hypothetical protein